MKGAFIAVVAVIVLVTAVSVLFLSHSLKLPSSIASSRLVSSVPILYKSSLSSIINTFPSLSMSVNFTTGSSSTLNENINYERIKTINVSGNELYGMSIISSNSTSQFSSVIYLYSNGSVDGNYMATIVNLSNENAMKNYIESAAALGFISTLNGTLLSTIPHNVTVYHSLSNSTYTENMGGVNMKVTKYTLDFPVGNSSSTEIINSLSFIVGEPVNGPSTEIMLSLNANVTNNGEIGYMYINVHSLSVS